MLMIATMTTPEVTVKAGHRLLELIAPHEAADYLDRKAERERIRAEEARWFEMTSTPIAGCKELRVRLEASTMNTLARLVQSLTQPTTGDRRAPAKTGDDHTGKQAGEQSSDVGEAALSAGEGVLPAGGAPGAESAVAGLLPLERRRADAMAELIHAMAQPHPADELDPTQLRRLATLLETETTTTPPTTTSTGDGGDGSAGDDSATTATAASTGDGGDGRTGDGSAASASTGDGSVGDGSVGGGEEEDGGGQLVLDTCDQQDQNTDNDPDHGQSRGRGRGRVMVPGMVPAQRAGAPGNPPASGMARGSMRGSPRGTMAQGRRWFRGERASLIVVTNYDHALRQYRAGEATSPGAPAPSTLSPTDVQTLECEALVTPVWMTENQTPVSVASPNRYFRGKHLAALIARDRGCVFPGCGRGLRYAHAHHITPVSKGGTTTVNNGVLLCATHHRLIHTNKHWQVHLATDQLPEFTPPHHLDPTRTPKRHTRHQLQLPIAA